MVKIVYKYPNEIGSNANIKRTLENAAMFVRDLWLARAPYATGAYAAGLLHSGSVKVGNGEIVIENKAKHAAVLEHGFSSYNLGLAILNGGKGVKTSKDGNRYKKIVIGPSYATRYRQKTVQQQVQKSFSKLAPLGLKPNQFTKYGGVKKYTPRKSLQQLLKPKQKPGQIQILTISEKAIKEDPTKWRMPAREGRKIAAEVQKDARQVVTDAIRAAIQNEKGRMQQRGRTPAWYKPTTARQPLKAVRGARK